MPSFELPLLEPCPYCESFVGRFPAHGPPAVIAEDDAICVFLAPASLGGMEGHTLVVPRRHVETILDLTDEEASILAIASGRVARMLAAALDVDGILVDQRNGVAAEQTVPHVHVHVIPRRAGVPFPPPEWIPVTPADERAQLAAKLRQHWDAAGRP